MALVEENRENLKFAFLLGIIFTKVINFISNWNQNHRNLNQVAAPVASVLLVYGLPLFFSF